jgi:hypothetical protein
MLIYLDANIVQYCADESDFIFGKIDTTQTDDTSLRRELTAIRRLVDLEQLGNWEFAAPRDLLAELRAGKPTAAQQETYNVLEDAWDESRWTGNESPTREMTSAIEEELSLLKLKHAADRRHLGEALALGASWFLTNDREVIRKTRGKVRGMRVCRPAESLEEISIGLFLK